MPDSLIQIDPDINHFNNFNSNLNCKYYSINEYNYLARNTNDLIVMTYNLRSFQSHIDHVHSMMHSSESYPEILVLTETWFTDEYDDTIPGFFPYHSIRSTRRSGGVSVLVKDQLSSRLWPGCSYVTNDIEVCTVEVTMNDATRLTVVGVYRPIDGVIDNFIASLTEILCCVCSGGKRCVLLGDLNINLLNENYAVLNFTNFMNSNYFQQYIAVPTRFSNNTHPSLIDHIWYNDANIEKCGAISFDFTDHLPCFISLKHTAHRHVGEVTKITFRLINEQNTSNFLADVNNFDWNEIYAEDINTCLENFMSSLDQMYCNNFPLKTKTVTNKQLEKPWLTPDIKLLINKKSEYFQLFRHNIVTLEENNRFKNRINAKIKKAKFDYYKNSFDCANKNSKATWSLLSSLISGNLNRKPIRNITHNNAEYTDETEIANLFNVYFNNIADELDNNLPQSPHSNPLQYVTQVQASMYLFPVSESELLNYINSLKPKRNQNKNSITVNLFKSAAPYLVGFLCRIINEAFSSGIFPNCLKQATITPVYKKGEQNLMTNYRPISILSFMSKLFEKCLLSRLVKFLDKFSVISKNQYGFMKNKSTEDALIAFTDHVYEALDNRQSSIGIFIDYSKAFDTIDHSILISKLWLCGIRGLPLKILTNYLKERSHCVKIGKSISQPLPVTRGVSQGSLLGPVLFLIYINELNNISNSFKPILYADDTTLLFTNNDETELINTCNNTLNLFQTWSESNRLTINLDKSFYMIITNRQRPLNISLKINNRELEQVQKVKFLGVIVDNKINFSHHTNYIGKKISRSVGVMYRIKHLVPAKVLRNVYNSLILPYLNYCIAVWGGTFISHLDHLIRLQKKSVRLICNKPYREHTNPLFLTENLLKLPELHKYQLVVHFFKTEKYTIHSRPHNYDTRNRQSALPPYQRLTTTQHSVSFQGSTMWNRLPPCIRSASSLAIFKRRVRQHYIDQYSN